MKTIILFSNSNNRKKSNTFTILFLLIFSTLLFSIEAIGQSCREQILSTENGASIDMDETGITQGTLCLLCAVNNPENVIGAEGDAATIVMTAAVGSSGTIYVNSNTTYLAGNPAGFVVQDPSLLGLLDVDLLNAITITTYDANGNTLETFDAVSNSLLLTLFQDTQSRLEIIPTVNFTSIAITINADLIGVDTSLDVFYAFAEPANLDSDNDGIPDAIEDANGDCIVNDGETDANDADSDDDGLDDGVEDANANGIVDAGETDPTLADSDNDGLDDGTEDANGNGIVDAGETDPTLADSDNDGLDDGTEDANGNGIVDEGETDPNVADSDNDGLDDGTEDANGNGIVDAGETDPNVADSDNDGLDDGTEDANGNGIVDAGETDPTLADSDNDGLDDGTEDANGNGIVDAGETDPTLADSDNDGLDDGTEDANGNGIVDAGETDPNVADSDNDGLDDGTEDANGNGIVDEGETDPNDNDSDNDGLSDGTEDANGNGIVDEGELDPNSQDTDNDGVNDGVEVASGSDPVDPCSPNPNSAACIGGGGLPVHLVTFEANAEKGDVILTWTTATETDFLGFELQRVTDNRNAAFETIATIAGKGSSATQTTYEYKDNDVRTGVIYYYQLVEKDVNGEAVSSHIISIQIDADNEVAIYPNPSTNWINVETDLLSKETLDISILNISGQVVQNLEYTNGNTEKLTIDISQLSKGMYFLQITTEGERISKKFFVE